MNESETITLLEKQVSELKYFIQKGFEKVITLENIVTSEITTKNTVSAKTKSNKNRR